MKRLSISLAMFLALSAAAYTSAPVGLGVSPFADTEISTNVACRALPGRAQAFTLSLDLSATPSNNVEVAFGMDVDCDGDLAPDEVRFAVGWDCGAWFWRMGADAPAQTLPAASGERTLTLSMRLRPDGTVAVFECRDGTETLPFHAMPPGDGWNLVRLTARGVDSPGAAFTAECALEGMSIRFR